jgi:four helix bundle protein
MNAICLPPHSVDREHFEGAESNGIDKVGDKVLRQSGGNLRPEVCAGGSGWLPTELPSFVDREHFEGAESNGIDKVDDKVGRQSGGNLRPVVWVGGSGWLPTLDVYRAALGFMEWFAFGPRGDGLSDPMVRQIDESGTSVVLNIAEGNGRYAELDHHRFLHIANSAAVKAAVYLDLCGKRGLWTVREIASGKAILLRVNDMLGAF